MTTTNYTDAERAERIIAGVATITYKKAQTFYSDFRRWEVYVDGIHVGWVIGNEKDEWRGWSSPVPTWSAYDGGEWRLDTYTGVECALGRSRKEAAQEVAWRRRHDIPAYIAYAEQEAKRSADLDRLLDDLEARYPAETAEG